jgi:hypothetical protein
MKMTPPPVVKVLYDKMRDEQVLPENRWPYMGSRVAVQRRCVPRMTLYGANMIQHDPL